MYLVEKFNVLLLTYEKDWSTVYFFHVVVYYDYILDEKYYEWLLKNSLRVWLIWIEKNDNLLCHQTKQYINSIDVI